MSAPVSTDLERPAATSLRRKDLLGIADMAPDEISLVLDTAEAMKEIGSRPIKKVPALRGKTVVNLFYEPSTRTIVPHAGWWYWRARFATLSDWPSSGRVVFVRTES